MAAPIQMFGFWRSQATYRLRVALKLKGIPYKETPINLDAGEQHSASFRKLNPLGSVPALMVDSGGPDPEPLTQSLAVLEYLEETHPKPALLPSDPLGRARVRSLASIAVADSHPLIVPRVRAYLTEHAGYDAARWKEWQTHWFRAALQGWEARLAGDERTGTFCHGDEPTVADVCLVGVVQGTRAFGIEIGDLPTVRRIVARCEELDAFEQSKAVYQSDFPAEKK